MAQRTVNDTDTGVGPVTRTRTAKAKVSGPRPSDLPAAERSNRDDDLQGAMMDLFRQQQRTMEALTKELTTRARLEQNHASGPNPQPAATTKARRMELPRLEAPSEVTLTDYNDWKVRFRDYVVLTRLMEEIPSVLGRQAELRAALAPPWSKLWQTGRLRVEDNDDVEEVLEKLGVYLRGQRNPLLDRREFFLRDQLKNESIDDYVVTLALLDDLGDYDDSQLLCPGCRQPCQHGASYRDGRIRDRLICGLWDKDMQKQVLREPFDSQLSLDKVIRICKSFEAATLTNEALAQEDVPRLAAFRKRSSYKAVSTPGKRSGKAEV